MKNERNDILIQSEFCENLMMRLHNKILLAEISYGKFEGYTQMENDIIRLRRELNELRKMLYPY